MQPTMDSLREAVRISNGTSSDLNALGLAWAQREDFVPALDSLARAVKADPTNIQYQCDLGRVLAAAGKFREALEIYQGVLDKDPLRLNICENTARLYAEQLNDPERAIPLFLRAVAADP